MEGARESRRAEGGEAEDRLVWSGRLSVPTEQAIRNAKASVTGPGERSDVQCVCLVVAFSGSSSERFSIRARAQAQQWHWQPLVGGHGGAPPHAHRVSRDASSKRNENDHDGGKRRKQTDAGYVED